jgi:hypothetical protein
VFDDYVYALGSGVSLAAWRSDPYFSPCHVFSVVPYADIVSLILRTSESTLRLASAPPATAMSNPSFQALPGFEQTFGLQELATSTSVFAFDIAPASIVYRTTIDSGTVQTTLGKQMGVALLLSFVEGNDVFAYSAQGTVGYAQIYTVAADGTPTLFRGAPDHDVSALATDGTSLVWTETYTPADGGMPTLQFWTAPYTAAPATLASTAHQVAAVPGVSAPFEAIAFGGIYTVYDGAAGQFVVRLSDGHVINPAPPAGYDFWKPAYVSNTELWIGLSITNGPKAVGLRRIPLGTW